VDTIWNNFFLGKQFDHIRQRLEPARTQAVLKPGYQLAIRPLKEQTKAQQEQTARKQQKRNQGRKRDIVHL